MLLLVWRDLLFRRWRALAVTVLMAIVITLLFLLTGLVGQFNAEPALAVEQVSGDRTWLVPEGTAGPFTSAQAVPAALFANVGDPVLLGRANAEGTQVFIAGRTSDGWDNPTLAEGRYATGPGEVAIDSTIDAELGDDIDLNGRPATVVGIVDEATVLAGVPIVFTTLTEAQDRIAAGEAVAIGALSENPPEPLPAGMVALSSDDVIADTLSPLESAVSSITLTQTLLWLITSIIIGAVVYITALERTRDFAVLKAVGGRTRDLGLSLLVQGVLMTLLAVALAGIIQSFVAPFFPLTIRIPASAWWRIPLIGTVVATVAAVGGMWKVANTSPAEAFS